jgi:hypothetical protein
LSFWLPLAAAQDRRCEALESALQVEIARCGVVVDASDHLSDDLSVVHPEHVPY